MARDLFDRIAGAPISWGVDGSPGWGHLMDPDRVLAEMVEVGLRATELGPDGYLGSTTVEVLERLDRHGLELIGGFIPVVLHDEDRATTVLEYFERAATTLAAGGARIAVVGPDSHHPGYDRSIHLDESDWSVFFRHLERLEAIATRCGVTPAIHPHWGMAVEDEDDIHEVLDRSGIGFCLDTGHFAVAEVDIAAFVEHAADRTHHVHLKDVDLGYAARVRSGDIGFRQAVIEGMFRPLGAGGVDVAGTVVGLEERGFQGWYVLEQDISLAEDPAPGRGPVEDARQSYEFLRSLAVSARSPQEEATG